MMRCSVLAGLLLGWLAVCSHAIALKSAFDIHTDTDTDTDEGEDMKLAAAGLTGVLTDLDDTHRDADIMQRTDLDALVDVDGTAGFEETADAEDASVTLSPEQRKAAHDWLYTVEFWVEINMTRAHETGMQVGMITESDEEWKPVKVFRIRKNGLVQEWNNAHPGQDIHVEDEIVQVNHINWHHNATSFQQRLTGQVKAMRMQTPGAPEMLRLHIMRPRQESKKRFALEREDAHRKAYSAEFTAPLRTEIALQQHQQRQEQQGAATSDAQLAEVAEQMGWALNISADWIPISILEIKPDGMLDRWNAANPDQVIVVGDEVLGVNRVSWISSHNSTIFLNRIWQQFVASRDQPDVWNQTFSLAIRRPRAVQDAYDKLHPLEEYLVDKDFPVMLNFTESRPDVGARGVLGWQLAVNNETGRVVVSKIGEHGMIMDWNTANFETGMIKLGDELRMIKGGDDMAMMDPPRQNPEEFLARANELMEKAALGLGPEQPLSMILSRKTTAVRRLSAPRAEGDVAPDTPPAPIAPKNDFLTSHDDSGDSGEGWVGAED